MVSSFSVEDMNYFISLEPSIAINEAIQLAKDFGSDSSYNLRYIHVNADQCVPVLNIADYKT